MANNVTATSIGAQPKVFNNVSTVEDIIDQLDLDSPSIKVNGQTVNESYSLSDYDFVSFGEKVKGGC
jgi:sulfur carrier protein ThiS